MSGVKSEQMAIWLAAVTAFVNFIFTFVGLWLVERIGRRKLTIGSIAGNLLWHTNISLDQPPVNDPILRHLISTYDRDQYVNTM